MSATPPQIAAALMAGGAHKIDGISATPGRGYVLTGASAGSATGRSPSAGERIDGVSVDVGFASILGIAATPGMPVQVRAGGTISDGDDLQVQSDGDFITPVGGAVVGRALESASAGQNFWMVFA